MFFVCFIVFFQKLCVFYVLFFVFRFEVFFFLIFESIPKIHKY